MRLVALFLFVALAEMAAFVWLGSQIGFAWALGMAVITAVIGSILVRRTGISVFTRFREKTGSGQLPGRELSDGAAVLVAGAFLISPGFITDILGFLLLVPGVRALVYRRLSAKFVSKVTVITGQASRPRSESRGEVIDVEGDVVEPKPELGGG